MKYILGTHFYCKAWKIPNYYRAYQLLMKLEETKRENNFCINLGKTVNVFHWSVPDVHCASVVVV